MSAYLVVTGGTVSDDVFEAVLLEYSFQKIIAADKGLEACHRKGIIPDVLIGDFDSADIQIVKEYREKCECIELPVHKDHTDTHVALLYAIENGCDLIVILGATGTRLDHTWANIGLLKLCMDHHIKAYAIDSHNRISITGETVILEKNSNYPYVSLIPYTEQVTGITLSGFEYAGENITLKMGESLGISNSIVEREGIIQFNSGNLLIIESHD